MTGRPVSTGPFGGDLLARDADLEPGMVIEWIDGDPRTRLMLLRPGKVPGDWLGVRVQPGPDEDKHQEWLAAGSQIAAGRYRVVGRIRRKEQS